MIGSKTVEGFGKFLRAQFREINSDFGLCGLVEPEHLGFAFEELDHSVDGFELLGGGNAQRLLANRVFECGKFTKVRLDVLLDAGSGFAAPIFADGLDVAGRLGLRYPGLGRDL